MHNRFIMCSYISIGSNPEDFENEYDAEFIGNAYKKEFKINGFANPAVPIILDDDTDHIVSAQWGFLPS